MNIQLDKLAETERGASGFGVQGGEQDVYSSTNHSCGRGGHCCIFRRDRLWSEL